MFTHNLNKKNKSNFTSAAQSNGRSRKSNNLEFLRGNLNIQAKLIVGQPNDKYEQEADRVADQVMRTTMDARLGEHMPANDTVQRRYSSCEKEDNSHQTKPLYTQISPLIQRQPIEEEEIQTKPLIQRQPVEEEEQIQMNPMLQPQAEEDEELQPKRIKAKGGNELAEVSSETESKINQSRGSGRHLPSDTRSFMERRFGTDFNNVKVHSDSTAIQMNKEVNSQAFTVGNNIYFNSGKYKPETDGGRQLLAHELTHVVQQGGGSLTPDTQIKPLLPYTTISQNNTRVRGWASATPGHHSAPDNTVQRKIKVDPGLNLDMHGYTHSKSGDVYTVPRVVKSNTFHEIFTSVLHSPRTFKLKGSTNKEIDKSFTEHRSARQGVVNFAAKKKYTFGAGSAFKMNPKYWNVTSTSWSLKPGANRVEAINDLNKNPDKYNIACLAATLLTMEGGGKSPTKYKSSGDNNDWIPGDWGYITNNNFTGLSVDVGLEGENIIYMGKDKFWGHFGSGNTFKTLAQWEKTVKDWNGAATIESQRTFPNAGLE